MVKNVRNDRGASAVEFAIVLPVFLLVIFGLINFGQAFFTKISLDHSAREAVRVAALGGDAEANANATFTYASPSNPLDVDAVKCAASVTEAKVTLTAKLNFWVPVAPIFDDPIDLTAVGVAKCY